MSFRPGTSMKVTLGSNSIVGMGTVTIGGVTADQLDSSEFGDKYYTYILAMKQSGDLQFSGIADPDDTDGQTALRDANAAGTDITDLRVYIDETSYWTLNQTAGTLPVSYCNIVSWEQSGEKAGLLQASFTAKVSGALVLV